MTAPTTMQRFEKASRNVLRMVLAGLKGMVMSLITEPKMFLVFIVLLIFLVIVSYYSLLLLFLTPVVIFYIALWVGRGIWEARKKKPVGFLGRIFIFLLSLMIVTPSMFGFFVYDTAVFKAAKLPKGYTDAGSKNGWNLDEDPGLTFDHVEQAGLVRYSMRTYMFDQGQLPPYPGIIFIVTIKSSPYTNGYYVSDLAKDEAKRQVDHTIITFEYKGLTINKASKTEGSRTTRDGNPTQYFDYTGKLDAAPTDPRFQNMVAGAKVKIRGEVWKCPETGTIIAVGGVAQYGYTFETGTFKAGEIAAQKDYHDDDRTWTTVKNLIIAVDC